MDVHAAVAPSLASSTRSVVVRRPAVPSARAPRPTPDAPRPIVAKISGSLLDDDVTLGAFWASVRHLRRRHPVVVVHGGGVQATDMARRLGHEPHVVQGRRVTTDLDLDIVQWALRGKVNTQLVAKARQHDVRAVGLSGADGGLLRVTKRPPWTLDGQTVDFGWVGDVEEVDTDLLGGLVEGGFVPVVAPLGMDAEGQVYNVNADTVARALAAALGAEELLLVTPTGGVRRDPEVPASHLDTCDAATFDEGVAEGWIAGGMRVKLHTAFEALRQGVERAVICAPHDLITRSHATRVVGRG